MANDVPPGWYPDPSGQRRWRVWTGTQWSHVTRDYGRPATADVGRGDGAVALALALQRMLRVGVVGVVGGLSLMVNVLVHWPGTAHPTPQWFAVTASGLATALLTVGSFVSAETVRALRGRWTVDAVIPGINFLAVGALVAARLGRTSHVRTAAEVVLLVIFTTSSRAAPWLDLAPVVVAFGRSAWLSVLLEQTSGDGDAVTS